MPPKQPPQAKEPVSEPKQSPTLSIAPGESLVPLQAPEGASACTIDDIQYQVVDGRALVLERHVEPLRAIGFSYITE